MRSDVDQTACTSDSNECTNNVCIGGTCTPLALTGIACTDDGNECTENECDDGVCEPIALTGGACTSDGNECTEDFCNAGVCGTPVLNGTPCIDDGNLCTFDQCGSGVCTHTNKGEGTSCGDDSWCNGQEVCNDSGVCATMGELCTTAIPCQLANCTEPTPPDTMGECDFPTAGDGDSCDDSQFCNGDDECWSGICEHDGTPCGAASAVCKFMNCDEGADSCDEENWAYNHDCADIIRCDGDEICDGLGDCVAGSPPCMDFGDCTTEECTENAGDTPTCGAPVNVADGSTCDTGNVCSGMGGNQCLDGTCLGGTVPPSCDLDEDEDLCTYYLDCDSTGGVPDCTIAVDLGSFGGEILSCSGTGDVDNDVFDTGLAINEVSSYGGSCSGNFTGGEAVYKLDVPTGAGYSVGFTVDSCRLRPS